MAPKKAECKICLKRFRSLTTHMKMKHKSILSHQQNCKFCGEKFTEYKTHMREVHSGNDFKCHICKTCFGFAEYLSEHMNNSHQTIDDDIKEDTPQPTENCDICGDSFSSPKKLTLHVNNVHIGKGFKPFFVKKVLVMHKPRGQKWGGVIIISCPCWGLGVKILKNRPRALL